MEKVIKSASWFICYMNKRNNLIFLIKFNLKDFKYFLWQNASQKSKVTKKIP